MLWRGRTREALCPTALPPLGQGGTSQGLQWGQKQEVTLQIFKYSESKQNNSITCFQQFVAYVKY